jgi:esterase/lipase
MQNILLLHGALGASTDLEPLSKALIQKGFSVYSFSFSGHGKTKFENDFNVPQFSKELETFIQSNKLEKLGVFGYSMGGYVALNLAQKSHSLIDKIITLGTKFNWSAEAVGKEVKQLNPDIIQEKVPGFANMLEQKHGSSWKDLLTKTASLMQDIHTHQYLSIESLTEIKIPVLIGLADKDQMVSLDETVSVYKTLGSANMYMLPNTKHPMESVDAELLSTLIENFIGK